MIKGSIPEFFPKVDRADSASKSKKEADASELLSSSSASSSGVKSSKAPEFKDALRDARAQKEAQKQAKEQAAKSNQYNSQGEVSDGSQPQNSSKLQVKVSRKAVDSKKDLESKSKKNDDFVMPGILAQKFSTPKRGLETEISDNELVSDFASQDSLMGQEAVSEFVEQMQEQFGITPEQIVAAFSQLSPQVLAAPVSESTQAFVNELPLSADQKPQVAALYSQMLEQSGDQVFSEQMTGNQQTAVGTQVLGQKEYNQQVLDKSLREMNQQFFQNAKVENKSEGKVSVAGMTAATGSLATAQSANGGAASVSSSGIAQGKLSPVGEKSSDSPGSAAAAFYSGMTSALGSEGQTASSQQGGEFGSQQQQQQSQSSASQLKSQTPIMAAGAFTPEIAKAKAAGEGKETKALKGDDLLNALNGSLSHGLTSTKLADTAALSAGAMLPGAVQPNAEDKTVNIQNLIKQAQVIIKEGGGEMKLEMSPEGMGQVNLKVAVENGQVNIQMITQNKEAKKMIEEGLSELKASLAAHKLQVDTLKVDLSEGVSKQMQEQLSDHKQNQAREFAQNFLGNMREERQGFRQGFFDNSGYKAYKNSTEREGGLPQPDSVTASSSAKKKQTDRRLDMVA